MPSWLNSDNDDDDEDGGEVAILDDADDRPLGAGRASSGCAAGPRTASAAKAADRAWSPGHGLSDDDEDEQSGLSDLEARGDATVASRPL